MDICIYLSRAAVIKNQKVVESHDPVVEINAGLNIERYHWFLKITPFLKQLGFLLYKHNSQDYRILLFKHIFSSFT